MAKERRDWSSGVGRVLVVTRRVLLVLGTAVGVAAGAVEVAKAVRDFNEEKPAPSCTSAEQATACEQPKK